MISYDAELHGKNDKSTKKGRERLWKACSRDITKLQAKVRHNHKRRYERSRQYSSTANRSTRSNVPPCVPRLPYGETLFFSRLPTTHVHAGIDITTISCCSLALAPPEHPYAIIPCARLTVLWLDSSLLSIFASTSRFAQRRLSVLVRSKQGALGSLGRADHLRPARMLTVAVGGR